MRVSKLIVISAIALSNLTFASLCLSAKGRDKATKKHTATTGIKTGKDVLFKGAGLYSTQNKMNSSINKSLFFKKQIANHYKVETGINYSVAPNQATENYPHLNSYNHQILNVSIPVTLQYYLLPEKCRVNPYCGAGVQYNISGPAGTALYQPTGDAHYGNMQSGSKYISIIFTQGVTFEVNTKIEVTQSFHFLQNNTEKTIGIDLGIGYKLP